MGGLVCGTEYFGVGLSRGLCADLWKSTHVILCRNMKSGLAIFVCCQKAAVDT